MSQMISGGVCAALGFRAAGLHVGVKTHAAWKKDVALIVSDVPCTAAAMFTKNVVKAAPIHVTMDHLAKGKVRAIIANSGNANACAPQGEENAEKMCAAAAKAIGCAPEDVLVASTGVIGQPLPMDKITDGVKALLPALTDTEEAAALAAEAIMTTDTRPKQFACEFELGGKTCHMGGMCKGSGMIHPNMGTMLCFITTDAAIDKALMQEALAAVADDTFNMISVDGDTSTNDSVLVMANGLCGNEKITARNADYDAFYEALYETLKYLSIRIAEDGEGATKLIEVTVRGAATRQDARVLAKSVITSSLTKAAIFGRDANWGRVLCAMGYSSAEFDPDHVDISFASGGEALQIVRGGLATDYSEEKATELLSAEKVAILIDLSDGEFEATAWGCDLTHEYVSINADYRS